MRRWIEHNQNWKCQFIKTPQKRVRTETTNREKIFVTYLTENGSISRLQKEILQANFKNNQPNKKIMKYLNGNFIGRKPKTKKHL